MTSVRSLRLGAAAAAVTMLLAGCATVVGGTGRPAAGPTSAASSGSSAPSSPSTSSSVPSSAPSSGSPSSSAPSSSATPTIKGWHTVSTEYHVAYDVPPDWKVLTPTTIVGWENDAGIILTMHSAAELDAGYCPGDSSATDRGLTGVAATGGSPSDAAHAVMALVPKIFADDDGSHRPTVKVSYTSGSRGGAQTAIGVATVSGVHRHSSCGPPAAVLYAVAIKPPGRSLAVFVGTLDQGNAGAEPVATLARIAGTVRPA